MINARIYLRKENSKNPFMLNSPLLSADISEQGASDLVRRIEGLQGIDSAEVLYRRSCFGAIPMGVEVSGTPDLSRVYNILTSSNVSVVGSHVEVSH